MRVKYWIMAGFVCFLSCTPLLFSQGSAGTAAPYESRVIVDMPTAGVLSKNTLGLQTVAFADGGILADVSFAPFTNFNIGLGYSGTKILGTGSIVSQGLPSLHLRYRIIDETLNFPAVMLGINTQGRGVVTNKRFETRAAGVFGALSKQYKWPGGTVSLHGGIGYSVDLGFDGAGVNVWGGIEQSLGGSAALQVEFNPVLNESKQQPLLNLALRWAIVSGVTLELQARDVFGNLPSAQGATRTLAIEVIRRL
ncbi:MAG: hypothetical protein U0Y96_05165 [Candidatus Kapaibacterium sp.]|nr:hypothetical protein [Bacteroidota bacterium]